MPLVSEALAISASIDQNKLLERCMGNGALVQKLLLAFLHSLPIEKKLLEEAIQTVDLCSVARIAHKLRGTALNMCARPLSEAALQVELAARSNEIDLVSQKWFDLNQSIEMLMNSLTRKCSCAL